MKAKYPFRTMAVGDQFEIPLNALHDVSRKAWRITQATGAVFVFRKVDVAKYVCVRTA